MVAAVSVSKPWCPNPLCVCVCLYMFMFGGAEGVFVFVVCVFAGGGGDRVGGLGGTGVGFCFPPLFL